MYLIYKTH